MINWVAIFIFQFFFKNCNFSEKIKIAALFLIFLKLENKT